MFTHNALTLIRCCVFIHWTHGTAWSQIIAKAHWRCAVWTLVQSLIKSDVCVKAFCWCTESIHTTIHTHTHAHTHTDMSRTHSEITFGILWIRNEKTVLMVQDILPSNLLSSQSRTISRNVRMLLPEDYVCQHVWARVRVWVSVSVLIISVCCVRDFRLRIYVRMCVNAYVRVRTWKTTPRDGSFNSALTTGVEQTFFYRRKTHDT